MVMERHAGMGDDRVEERLLQAAEATPSPTCWDTTRHHEWTAFDRPTWRSTGFPSLQR
jgi:hypothetical protein